MADTQLSTYIWVIDNGNDTAEAKALVATALSRMVTDIDTLLTARVDLRFRTPAQMVANGETLADGSAAWGFCHSNSRSVTINTKINGLNLPPERTQYTVLHELGGHMSDEDVLNASKRAALMALMTPAPTGWGAGSYLNLASECYADTFVRAFSDIDTILVGFFNKQIASADYAAYRTIVTGAGVPVTLALAASASIGATNIKVTTVTGLAIGDWIAIGTGEAREERELTFVGTAGSGGTGISFAAALTSAWANGTAVTEIAPPPLGGGTPGTGPDYSITINGADWTNKIPAHSIRISESGSDSVATLEFTIESTPGGNFSDAFPWDVLINDLVNNRRLFGGTFVGVSRRHGPGNRVISDCRCVSFDAWLDRRYLAKWWTTDSGTQAGNKLVSDRLIVQRIIADGAAGGVQTNLIAADATVSSTNAAMPKMNLEGSSLRQMILAVAEQAATLADPGVRRVYVDFYRKVHYYKGSEGNSAPYRVGDANYSAVVRATNAGLVSHWGLGEASGATAYDAKSYAHATIAGYHVRSMPTAVVNEPQKGGIYISGTGYASASGANLTPGDTFSIELWFRRGGGLGTAQTLISGGANDYQIQLYTDNKIRFSKNGASQVWISNSTYTSTTAWYHLVLTKSGATTTVYINGSAISGTTTNATIVGSSAINIGRDKRTSSEYFIGTLQHVAIYSSAMSAADALAHYRDGVTLVPDYIEADTDYNDSGDSVYVAGTGASGWAPAPHFSPYAANTIIDRPEVTNASMLLAAGAAFLARDFATAKMVRFRITGYGGWRAGQTVAIDDAGLGVLGNYEIKDIQTTSPFGAVLVYEISAGAMPWRGTFDIKRKTRKGGGKDS